MKKHELVKHLESVHGWKFSTPTQWTTKAELEDSHRQVHKKPLSNQRYVAKHTLELM